MQHKVDAQRQERDSQVGDKAKTWPVPLPS